MATTPHPLLHQPRRTRAVHPGPRIRLLETLLLLISVAMMCLAILVAVLFVSGDSLLATILSVLGLMLLAFCWNRARRVGQLRRLARNGGIAVGRVIGTELKRFTSAPRADAFWPIALQPLRAVCVVHYRFKDRMQSEWEGAFLVSRKERPTYHEGRTLEIFYDPEQPRQNASSLVLRWYFRLAGASDETVPIPIQPVADGAEDGEAPAS